MRDGPRRFTRDFSCPALLRHRLGPESRFRVRGSHPLRRPFPGAFRYRSSRPPSAALLPRARPQDRPGLGCCAFARRYWRNRCYFLFLRVLRCFSSPRSLDAFWRRGGVPAAGLPHSEIRGSQGICPSPRLIAACHVLRRLREPQASPARLCPLSSLPFISEPSVSSRSSFRFAFVHTLASLDSLARFLSLSIRFLKFCVPNMSRTSFIVRSPRQT